MYKRESKLRDHELAKQAFREITDNNECYSLKSLAINGSDLIHLGITDGKSIGFILDNLLDEVINETLENDNVTLKKQALEMYAQI